MKKGQYQDALGKYSECLKLKPEECPIYTNRLEAQSHLSINKHTAALFSFLTTTRYFSYFISSQTCIYSYG